MLDARKKSLLGVALSLLLALGACGSGGSSKDESREAPGVKTVAPDTLTVFAYVPFPGYWDGVSDKKLTGGVEYEMAKYIQKSLGLEKLVVKKVNYTALTGGVLDGQYDIGMANIFVTPERKEVNQYSNCYADAHAVAVVKKKTNLQSIEDAKKLRWGVEVGASTAQIITAGVKPGPKVRQFQNSAAMFPFLLTEQVDAVLQGISSVAPFMAEKKYAGYKVAAIMKLDGADKNENCAAIQLSKDSPNLEKINVLVDRMKSEGLIDKWTSQYLTPVFGGIDVNNLPTIIVPAS